MRRFVLLAGVIGVVIGSGCTKAKKKPYDGPMPVTFGDCAGPKTSWLSGPKPAPFLIEDAKDVEILAKVAAKDPPPPLPPQDDPPPPEQPDDGEDESGGTGTAMAMDEGKLAKKGGDDPELARKQAIEAAREAGILGSTNSAQGGAFASLTGTGDISSGFDDTNIYGGLLGNEAGELEGSGFGPGGGGDGFGTIGTGRYGKIGHGSGTGSSGRSAAVPTVAIGQPNAQGDLDKAIIRRYVKRNIQKIEYCYEKELLVKPGLAGTVMTQFFIKPSGEVASASGSGVDPNVSSCVAGVIKAISFPKPKGGGGVQVNYPFTFRPAAGAAPVTAKADPKAGSGSAAGSAAEPPPPPPPPTPAPDPNAHKAPPPAPPGGYRPGANNPLRTEQAALETCFRAGKAHFGVAVFDFAYDARGAVTNADVHGIDDAQVKKCVLAVTKKVKSMAGQTGERCSVAFGEMPLAAAPSVEITATAVMFDGAKHGTIAELTAEDSLRFKIPSLFEAFDARMRAARAAVVTVDGPLVIKAIDAAKMKVVNKVLTTIVAAGEDYVLAHQAGADWQLLTPLVLPMVPVPFGTGDGFSYHRIRTRDASWGGDSSETVHLSVLVQADKIWVGLSRVNEFQELPRDPVKLGQALSAHKASAFFADRTDIEIAGDDDAAYIDVLHAIEAAQTAGFIRWQLTDPNGLSARPQP